MNPEETKRCSLCNKDLPISQFYRGQSYWGKSYPSSRCKSCDTKYAKTRRNAKGTQTPLGQAKDIGAYLGVYIAERLLANVFKTTIRMPYGNPGYDFICGKGFKVDVKAACRKHKSNCSDEWQFNIKQNATADCFACFAMDNRKSLNPEHFWLIPADAVNQKTTLAIFESKLALFKQYEQPLDNVLRGCEILKRTPPLEVRAPAGGA
jgi:hypothetical protein